MKNGPWWSHKSNISRIKIIVSNKSWVSNKWHLRPYKFPKLNAIKHSFDYVLFNISVLYFLCDRLKETVDGRKALFINNILIFPFHFFCSININLRFQIQTTHYFFYFLPYFSSYIYVLFYFNPFICFYFILAKKNTT
jgi:ATP/ADP translocase